jgi:hypothetical protein
MQEMLYAGNRESSAFGISSKTPALLNFFAHSTLVSAPGGS